MKKMSMIFLAALCLLWPMAGMAQEQGGSQSQGLPAFLDAVHDGVSQGLAMGGAQAAAAMDQELTIEIAAPSGRIEEGKTVTLTVKAGNPRPVAADVDITLKLSQRLAVAQESAWKATLPAAQVDDKTGELVPSVTTFTRDVTLMPGGESEKTSIECEMGMGTRFYRANMPLELCVSDISASAKAVGAEDGRLRPGDALTYEIEIGNAGAAPKDVTVDLTLPDGLELTDGVQGLACVGNRLTGRIRAEAAEEMEGNVTPSSVVVTVPVKVVDDALEGDEDAARLLSGQLRVDDERVPLPRIQVCGPQITARLLPEADSLKQGEDMALRVVVVNAGLAQADVRISCVLPDGLSLVTQEEGEAAPQKTVNKSAQRDKKKDEPKVGDERTEADTSVREAERDGELEATPAQALPSGNDGGTLQASAVLTPEAEEALRAVAVQEDGTLVFDLHMDAADEQDGGVVVNTRVLDLRVRADVPQENIRERMLGATLAWTTDGGQTELGEAVAVRVYSPMFLGLNADEWSGVFWAGLLLVITVACLYAAVCVDNRKDDLACD